MTSGSSASPDQLVGRRAPLVDASCTGTAIRSFIKVADERTIDEEPVQGLFGPPPEGALPVFGAPGQRA